MKLDSIKLELRGPQTGLSLYDGNDYIATYRSLNDCVLDLTYHFAVTLTFVLYAHHVISARETILCSKYL